MRIKFKTAILVGILSTLAIAVVSAVYVPTRNRYHTSGVENASELSAASVAEISHAPVIPLEKPPARPLDSRNPDLVNFVTNRGFGEDSEANPRVTKEFTTRIPTLGSTDEVAAVVRVLRDRKDGDTERNEAANVLRRTGYHSLDQELIAILDNLNETPRMRFFAMQHLGVGLDHARNEADRQVICDRIRRGLADRDLIVRRESFLALATAHDEVAAQKLELPIADPAFDGMRDVVIRVLCNNQRVDRKSEIIGLLSDSDEATRIAAIVGVGLMHCAEASDIVQHIATASPSIRERKAADATLKNLQAGTLQ